jgi:hypothetical protein
MHAREEGGGGGGGGGGGRGRDVSLSGSLLKGGATPCRQWVDMHDIPCRL